MARPKAFDPEQALERAMDVFWRQGYEATSVQDLVEGMGINRASLYGTFGDKKALFLRALERYCQDSLAGLLAALEGPGPAPEVLRGVFRAELNLAREGALQRGCLLTNTAMELGARCCESGRRVSGSLLRLEEAFRALIERGLAEGDLRGPCDARAQARALVALLQGVVVLAKSGLPHAFLEDAVRAGLAWLDAPGAVARRRRGR